MRMEKGVEWLGVCRENGEGGWFSGGDPVGRRGLSGWGSVVRREKGVEWLGLCREEGERG